MYVPRTWIHSTAFALLVGCSAEPTVTCEEVTGTLSGQILFGTADAAGSPAGFARVQAWDEALGESQDDALLISSDENGFYETDLPAAAWTLAAISEDGMSFSSSSTDLILEPCDEVELDFFLDEGFGR